MGDVETYILPKFQIHSTLHKKTVIPGVRVGKYAIIGAFSEKFFHVQYFQMKIIISMNFLAIVTKYVICLLTSSNLHHSAGWIISC